MRKAVSTAALVAALGFGGVASAADMYASGTKDAIYAPTWAGFYIGGTAGYSWNKLANADLDSLFGSDKTLSNDGFAGGGTVGVNLQKGGLVYGLEADISALTNSSSQSYYQNFAPPVPYELIKSKIDALATVRGRVGVSVDPAMLYVTAGLALGDVQNSVTRPWNAQNNPTWVPTWANNGWQAGWVAGAGLEAKWSEKLSWKVEGLYYQLGDNTLTWTNTGASFRGTFNDGGFIARAGVNYALTGVYAPLK